MAIVGLVPPRPSFKSAKVVNKDAQRTWNRSVMTECLRILLQPLRELGNAGIEMLCPDRKTRLCFLRTMLWPADQKEASILHNIYSNRCVKCETPYSEYENYVSPEDLISVRRDHEQYEAHRDSLPGHERERINNFGNIRNAALRLADHDGDREAQDFWFSDEEDNDAEDPEAFAHRMRATMNHSQADFLHAATQHTTELQNPELHGYQDYFHRRGVHVEPNNFLGLPGVNPGLLQSFDVLHVVQLGVLGQSHFMKWLKLFLEKHERATLFHDAWLSFTEYPGCTAPKTGFFAQKQWQGADMLKFSKLVSLTLHRTLFNPHEHEKDDFRNAIRATNGLVDYTKLLEYRSHGEKTAGFANHFLRRFHIYKEVFREFTITKTTIREIKAEQKALREAAKAPGLAAAERRALEDQATKLAAQTGKELGRFNFVKMHMLNHLHESIMEFGSVCKYSTALGESAHMSKLKAPHRQSNNKNVEPQIIKITDRLHALYTRLANLEEAVREGYGGLALRDTLNLYTKEDRVLVDEARRNQQSIFDVFSDAAPDQPPRKQDPVEHTRRTGGAPKKSRYLLKTLATKYANFRGNPDGLLDAILGLYRSRTGVHLDAPQRRDLLRSKTQVYKWVSGLTRSLHLKPRSNNLGHRSRPRFSGFRYLPTQNPRTS